MLLIGAAALIYEPLALAALVAVCGRLGGWTHHAMASLRIVRVTFGWSLIAGGLGLLTGTHDASADAAALLVLQGTVFLSHYVTALRSKLRLGPRPWSWATRNRPEFLVAAAYAWGWGRFLPERTARSVVRTVGSAARWLNWGTLAVEALGLVAFAQRPLAVLAIGCAILFNVVVVLCSGLFFLENIVTGAALIVAIASTPTAVQLLAFDSTSWLASLAVLLLVLGASHGSPLTWAGGRLRFRNASTGRVPRRLENPWRSTTGS
ncbi:hypothetical protein GXW82_10575 [Streptacidiphilus sp. 4-A2]|nr:hypothetical protein [Streptacidiphilus sp. 4-A2]